MAFLRLLKVTGYLQTFIETMVSLKFHDLHDETVLTVEKNKENETIFIHLECENEDQSCGIYLDKSTAIKFSKELRKTISLLD
jgi:hypothetical protein